MWHDRRETPSGTLERCFTDAEGGVSETPFSSFNLGQHVGDDEQSVRANRAALSAALGDVPIVWLNQVHGRQVACITEVSEVVPTADGVVTALSDVALAVMVADCTPVLLADEEAGVVAAAHAGRPGMLSGVVGETIAAMRRLGANSITASVGPSVCGRCYEVPQEMADAAGEAYPAARAITWSGTPAIDVASGVVTQLGQADVDVTWVPGCTVESPSLFSYRRDGQTGRFAGVIVRHS